MTPYFESKKIQKADIIFILFILIEAISVVWEVATVPANVPPHTKIPLSLIIAFLFCFPAAIGIIVIVFRLNYGLLDSLPNFYGSKYYKIVKLTTIFVLAVAVYLVIRK
jgi:hypothetical protein